MSEGACLSPFDAWLVLRGIKTLAVRMDRQSDNARIIAQFLRNHPKIDKVFYVGFPDHPQYGLSCRQSRGFGSMVSFTLKNSVEVPKVLSSLSLIMFAESLGGVETLMTYPIEQTHKAIPQEMLKRSGVQENLLRLSVGIENVHDLLQDLEQAFR
jgi:cystathionine gamma-synthase